MKKFIIPLMTVAVVAALLLGCMPGAPPVAPPVTPPPVAPPVTPPPVAPPVAPTPSPYLPGWSPEELGLELDPYQGLAVKSDGTPYNFAMVHFLLSLDFCAWEHAIFRSLIEKTGADVTYYDPNADPEKQISTMEDIIAIGDVDVIYLHPISEAMLGPVVDQAWDAGIPVFTQDFEAWSQHTSPFLRHWFDGPQGTNAVGEYYVQIAEETGKQINIFSVWGLRASPNSQARQAGFRRPVDKCPLITVTESADSQWTDEIAAELVMDAFTVYPELNAIFLDNGGGLAAVEVLRALGRLLPSDDPDHIIVAVNDMEPAIVQGMVDGVVDACGTHSPWSRADATIQLMLTNIVLGQPIPLKSNIPMKLLTQENLYTLKTFGGPAAYPLMPEDFDLWPILDFWNNPLFDDEGNSIRIELPTPALRMKYMGY